MDDVDIDIDRIKGAEAQSVWSIEMRYKVSGV